MRDGPLDEVVASAPAGPAGVSTSETSGGAEVWSPGGGGGAGDGEADGSETPVDSWTCVGAVGGGAVVLGAPPQFGKEKSSCRTEESPSRDTVAVPASKACASDSETTTVSCRLSPSRSATRVTDDPSKTTSLP